jgi:hypothetical protein
MLYQGLKKIPVVPVFSAHPIIFFNTIDRATLFSPGGYGLLFTGCSHSVPKWRLLSQ